MHRSGVHHQNGAMGTAGDVPGHVAEELSGNAPLALAANEDHIRFPFPRRPDDELTRDAYLHHGFAAHLRSYLLQPNAKVLNYPLHLRCIGLLLGHRHNGNFL